MHTNLKGAHSHKQITGLSLDTYMFCVMGVCAKTTTSFAVHTCCFFIHKLIVPTSKKKGGSAYLMILKCIDDYIQYMG